MMGSKATGLPCNSPPKFLKFWMSHHVEVVSAHHPDKLFSFAKRRKRTDIKVIIAGAKAAR
ncbi:hypothetical protein KCP71_24780 [Salmonella enterica subsp. enterica]|nr:hypothetical protein KCP71_24780 [Salmonella enterica subsp. enterica]